MKYSPLMISLLLSPIALANDAETVVEHPKIAQQIKTFTYAKSISRAEPKFPTQMARNRKEGWVQLSYIVDTEGKTQDISVINSSGSRFFERSAVNAVKKWRFEPATENGEKVEQCDTRVQMDFRMSNPNGGVRGKYKKLLVEAFDAIEKSDEEKLDETLNKLDRIDIQVMAEHSWLEFLKANAYKFKKDEKRQLRHLRRAVPSHFNTQKNTILPPAYVITVLQDMFILEYNNGLYADAIATFKKLDNMDGEQAVEVANYFRPHYDKLDNIIKNKKVMAVEGEISEFSNWSHDLVRSKFTISDVEGSLDKIDIRCRNKHFVYTFEQQNEFQIPKSYGQCQLIVEGKKGSQFTLSELL